jgi:hypothetical protein
MIMQPETGKLSVKEKIGYSLGDGAANFIFQTIMLLQLSFYTNYFRDRSRCNCGVAPFRPVGSSRCRPGDGCNY